MEAERTIIARLCICVVIACIGCGGETPPPAAGGAGTGAASTGSAAAAKISPLQFAADLPKLDEALPPLDDGRVIIYPPRDWFRHPRSSNYLALWTPKGNQQYPRIECRSTATTDVDLDDRNIERFAERMLNDEKIARSIRGDVRIAKMGPKPAVYILQHQSSPKGQMDVIDVITIVDAREYLIRLVTFRDEHAEHEKLLQAVMKAVEFPKSAN